MSFDYKNGEDYVCVLCGKARHASLPTPDKLDDGCWELKSRIEMQPDLARKVLKEIEE